MNHDIKALLERYVKRETSLKEDQLVEKWLEENNIADPAWPRLDGANKNRWLSDVLTDVKLTINPEKPKVVSLASSKYLWYKIAGAAILIIAFCLYLSWPMLKGPTAPQDLSLVFTTANQQKQVTLSDGTKIWLNSRSKLNYPKAFDKGTRQVYLSGEAYFDVKHDAKKPFLIHTGKVLTTVLGTAFNIKEDQNLHTIVVTVTRGKVSVADGDKLLSVLTKDQQVSLDLLNRIPTEKAVDAKTFIVWQESDLLFDDITFAEAAMQLERHFHVKITFNNEKLKNCRFSGSTLKSDKLDNILNAVSGFNNATWKKTADGHIVIYGEGCN